MDWLPQLFSYVCGQVSLWAPGGEVLPFCQRCTGLYVGGAYALLAWAIFRPRPTSAILWIHGLVLLLMIPFGYHLVPQNGEIRTLTGQLFAAGLACFLLLNPAQRLAVWRNEASGNTKAYLAAVVAGLPILQFTVHFGGSGTAIALAWIGLAGLAGFALLALANLVLLPAVAWGFLRKPQSQHP